MRQEWTNASWDKFSWNYNIFLRMQFLIFSNLGSQYPTMSENTSKKAASQSQGLLLILLPILVLHKLIIFSVSPCLTIRQWKFYVYYTYFMIICMHISWTCIIHILLFSFGLKIIVIIQHSYKYLINRKSKTKESK